MKNPNQSKLNWSSIALIVLITAVVTGLAMFYLVAYFTRLAGLPITMPRPGMMNSANYNAPMMNNNLDIKTWKTYSSSKYGFSFKYPSDWKLNNGGGQFGIVAELVSPELKESIAEAIKNMGYNKPVGDLPFSNDLTILVYSSIKQMDASTYKNLSDYINDPKQTFSNIGPVVIGGLNGFEVNRIDFVPSYAVFLVGSKGEIYELAFNSTIEKSELNLTRQTILTSFKFTK